MSSRRQSSRQASAFVEVSGRGRRCSRSNSSADATAVGQDRPPHEIPRPPHRHSATKWLVHADRRRPRQCAPWESARTITQKRWIDAAWNSDLLANIRTSRARRGKNAVFLNFFAQRFGGSRRIVYFCTAFDKQTPLLWKVG